MSRLMTTLAVTALALGGCAGAAKTYDAEGQEAYTLACGGVMRSWAMCLAKAGELCGTRGYRVTDRVSAPLVVSTTQGPILTETRTMAVTCGPEK